MSSSRRRPHGPATARFHQLVIDQELTHDGGSPLARHVADAILREDSRGAWLSTERKDSLRRIDGAVAPLWRCIGPPSWLVLRTRHLQLIHRLAIQRYSRPRSPIEYREPQDTNQVPQGAF